MKKINNPWFILGLEPGATLKEVKTAYKRLALKNHPDKGGTIADWLAISDAYEEIQKKNHVPILKSTDVQMIDLALTIEQQINGINDYIQIDEEEDLFEEESKIELDEDENPILFYNKKNQIFLMETGPQVFLPPQELKNDVRNLNLTNSLMRKCKTLGREQRKRYIELGKYCEECQTKNDDGTEDEDEPDDNDNDDDADDKKSN